MRQGKKRTPSGENSVTRYTNESKHGVRFDDAMLVFSDPYALVEQDRIEGGELRWQTLV